MERSSSQLDRIWLRSFCLSLRFSEIQPKITTNLRYERAGPLLAQDPPVLAEDAILNGMRKMKFNQVGGACDVEFIGESFAEIASQNQSHSRALIDAQDGPHIDAMSAMMVIINNGEIDAWMTARKAEFDSL